MSQKKYIHPNNCKTFAAKDPETQELINHTLYILENFGIPINNTPRRLERMAIAFLAISDVKIIKDFRKAKNLTDDSYALKSRDIINYVNKYFQEEISSGSYDDIRRKDLKLLVAAEIVLQSSPNSATNDSTRGYGLNPQYAKLLKGYPHKNWDVRIKSQLKGVKSLTETLKRARNLDKIPIELPSGKELKFSQGLHNDLQKCIIERFLPKYGFGAKVLYVGDTSNKYLHLDQSGLNELNFFEISHDELPDIIAYSKEKNWLYLIEAVHSSGAISELRLLQLKKLTEKCTADIIYITAFLDRATFRKFIADIAWETEVWIADNPDHLIHFNGDKFLGPYQKPE
ncbi:MAG: BsuBI/PstI family type II restriction endonuclease [Saprospiraceae bacterium]